LIAVIFMSGAFLSGPVEPVRAGYRSADVLARQDDAPAQQGGRPPSPDIDPRPRQRAEAEEEEQQLDQP
jgi:hypothetical protein